MENKHIISSNPHDDDDHKEMEWTKVVNSQAPPENDERNRYAHYDLNYAQSSQEKASLVDTEVEPHECCDKNGDLGVSRYCILLDFLEQTF